MSGALWDLLRRRHRTTIVLCSIVPILIGSVIGLVYPTYSKQREMLKFFKISTRFFGQDQIDLFSAAGAFTMPFQHPICLGLFALCTAAPGIGLIAGERGRGGLDLMLSTGLDRRRLVLTLGSFQLAIAPILALAALVGSFAGALLAGTVNEIDWGRFLATTLVTSGVCAFLAATATLVSVHADDRGTASLRFGILAFLFVLLDIAARLWSGGAWLAWLSPYGYLRPARIVVEGAWNMAFVRDLAVPMLGAAAIYVVALRVEHRRVRA